MMERLDHYAITSTYTGANSQFQSRLTAAGLFAIAAVAIVACSPTEELDNDATLQERSDEPLFLDTSADPRLTQNITLNTDPLYTFPGHTGRVWAMSHSPDGRYLASGGTDGTIRVWDLQAGRNVHTLVSRHGQVRSLAFSPDGTTLATGGEDGIIRLWAVRSGREQTAIQAHSQVVRDLAFDPLGRYIGSSSYDKTAKLWRVEDGTLAQVLRGHTDTVNAIAISPNGEMVATGSGSVFNPPADYSIRL
ncbi:MAG: WD40 repeat domain-containing protein [Pseudanabaenales cyanobacterium]|nr:WD40 repeat domain-containing protein [Pseudanabaenales cyanobacterium]